MPDNIVLATSREIKDTAWIYESFFAPNLGGGAIAADAGIRSYNEGRYSIYDTSPGGNRSINPAPQFCPATDPREPSMAAGSLGMGGYYAEAIDKHAQRISLQFGKAEFNSLTNFFASFYDRGMGKLVATGEASSGVFSSYGAGKVFGTLVTLPFQAYFGLNYLYQRVKSTLTGRPYSKFYYMTPTMSLYWNAVTLLVNQITATMNITHGFGPDELEGNQSVTGNVQTARSQVNWSDLASILPDVVRGDSHASLDVFNIATRAQRLADQYHTAIAELSRDAPTTEVLGERIREYVKNNTLSYKGEDETTLDAYMNNYVNTPAGQPKDTPATVPNATDTPTPSGGAQAELDAMGNPAVRDVIRKKEASLKDSLGAELRNGAAFATFTVEATGPQTESVSNTAKQTGIAEKVNSLSTTARDLRVNFANGNISDGPIGEAIETVVGGVRSFFGGALDSVGFSGLSVLGGATLVDIPKVHDKTTMEMPSTTYTMYLGGHSGHPLAVVLEQYMPLMMLLAGGLPQSTGPNSYSSPFYVRLHSQGRDDIKLGLIDSIQIERGVGNVGWTVDKLPAATKVTFTVLNMNEVIHMPLTDSLTTSALGFSAFDEDTAMSDYLAALSGISLANQFYLKPRLQLAWARTQADWRSLFSTSGAAQYATSTSTGQVVGAFARYGEI